MPELLTHSRSASFKKCRRQHYFSYVAGLRKKTTSSALRLGSAFHDGIEHLGLGNGLNAACDAVRSHYALCPDGFDELEWYYEQETCLRTVCAYDWRWSEQKLKYLAVEIPFQIPLVNPATGKASRKWKRAGKIDAIIQLEDGRVAVKESKFLGDDIGPESDLWPRLRLDQQISGYLDAARQIGYVPDCVLYDVARKPCIGPEQVPILDADGVKIVLDAHGERVKTKDGKKWRQTGDKELGYTLQTRPMTPEEWGDKLTKDITERPQFYFSRQEIARLDKDLMEYREELWAVQQTMTTAITKSQHYRTVSTDTCPWCSYFSICQQGELSSVAPSGFEYVKDVHPELVVNPKPVAAKNQTTVIEFMGEQIVVDSDPLPF